MKSLTIFIIFLVSLSANAANIDTLQNIQVNSSMEEMNKRVKTIEDRLSQLEESNKSILLWGKIVGVPIGVLSLYTIYLYFWGLKKKTEEEVEKIGKITLDRIAPDIIKERLENHPVIIEYKRIEAVKNKPILILGSQLRDINLENFLEQKGFKKTKQLQIEKWEDIDVNAYKLILFNNEDGELKQGQMDEVCKKYGNSFDYFYFQGKGEKWINENVKMSGFATTKERLENNLIDALSK